MSKMGSWDLRPLIVACETFYEYCDLHGRQINKYCRTCNNGVGCCPTCEKEFHGVHDVVQIRRNTYESSIHHLDVDEYVNTLGLHKYSINNLPVYFIARREIKKVCKMKDDHGPCEVCRWPIKKPDRYCCIECMLDSLEHHALANELSIATTSTSAQAKAKAKEDEVVMMVDACVSTSSETYSCHIAWHDEIVIPDYFDSCVRATDGWSGRTSYNRKRTSKSNKGIVIRNGCDSNVRTMNDSIGQNYKNTKTLKSCEPSSFGQPTNDSFEGIYHRQNRTFKSNKGIVIRGGFDSNARTTNDSIGMGYEENKISKSHEPSVFLQPTNDSSGESYLREKKTSKLCELSIFRKPRSKFKRHRRTQFLELKMITEAKCPEPPERLIPPTPPSNSNLKFDTTICPVFVVTLSAEEIVSDFHTMIGKKPPSRPRKRTQRVRKVLEMLSPGILEGVTPEKYEVGFKSTDDKR